MKKTGLGKGLDALFSSDQLLSSDSKEEELSSEKIYKIKVIDIEPNKEQPRRKFDEESLDELANSIKTYGVLQPIIVEKKDEYYEIIAGERRWRAAKKAGLTEMPCIIKEDISAKSNQEIALIENLQRVDLNPVDKARGLKILIDDYGMTQQELGESIGLSRSNIANSLRILNLTPRVLELAETGKLTEGHCKALAGITDEKRQYEVAIRMIERGESVRQAESKNRTTKKEKRLDPKYKYLYDDIEDKFQGFFGTKVRLDQGKRKGKIIIEYNNNEDLERMLNLIKG